MMKTLKGAFALAAFAFLAACGGGDSGTSVFDGEPPTNGNGNGAPEAPVAADLSVRLTNSSGAAVTTLPNSGAEKITAIVTALDSNRNVKAGIPVSVSVNANAEALVSAAQTDTAGVVTAEIGVGSDRSNRVITVTAVSGSLTRITTFQVIGARLTAQALPVVIEPGAAGRIEFTLNDSNSNAMSGVPIIVSGPGGVETAAETASNGEYTYSYVAPASPGPLEISASSGGVSTTALVEVRSESTVIPPAATLVTAPSISANPSVVSINTETTNNRSEIRALFIGNGNVPVRNIRVRFDLNGDPSAVGGSFITDDAIVYSNANGVATSAYIPASRDSAIDGVTIRACWAYVDFAAGTCPNQLTTTLTVVSDPLSVTIGTNEELEIGPTGLDYVKRYLVQVADSAGQAKSDVQISTSIDLPQYLKGYWRLPEEEDEEEEDTGDGWAKVHMATCDNEDLNRNGNAEIYSNGVVEDANGSFNLIPGRPALEPRKADVVLSFVGSSRTNASGQVVIQISYAKSVASWVRFNIVVSASGVSGSEGRANYDGILPVLATEVNDTEVTPAFSISPYGVFPSPVVLQTNPGGQQGLLCTNPN
jgi:hypothetical protein